ncbi:MAG TPA: vitamin B12-dependent ribonucleotide reductase [Desulfobacteria bacterium]|nr:vitamin B12-dependent ribonucleotide reductase [Desulfobacteria bacterium]
MDEYKIPAKWPKSKLTPNALKVLERRYLRQENGKVCETPEDMFYRVARAVAQVEEQLYGKSKAEVDKLTKDFYKLMVDLDFMPNSPTLMNAGRELGQLSACFVLPIEDSMDKIFDAIKNAAIIHKSGGGTGFSFSRLRPKNSAVRSTGGVASGPVSFMKVFNAATEAVKQGGTRRGANMGILRVDHPDILEFISCKVDNNEITNFNISVGITEKFMKAVENDLPYDLIDPHTNKVNGQLKAREVFNKIVSHAWKNGEPGIVFLDRLNKDNPTPAVGEIEATNPCGEQPLLPNEACNLGSINLKNMFITDAEGPKVDWERLDRITRIASRFLDNVIDANQYPLEVIEQMVKGNRKIGLGIMGFADLLIQLRIPYCSDEAVQLAGKLMNFIRNAARTESKRLAKERGVFPNFAGSIYDGVMELRNATITTIAPTGTISMICSASSGVEPLFAIAYTKTVMDGTELVEVNPLFEQVAKAEGFYSEKLMRDVAKTGNLHGVAGVPEWAKEVFVTAHEIAPEWHIKTQAAFQEYTDNAVSKTINFPNSATEDDIAEAYRLAYKLGCKGLTVYRDGSRETQVLSTGTGTTQDNTNQSATGVGQTKIVPRPRPETTTGITQKVKIGCGNLFVNVNSDELGICEVFTNTGKAGGCSSQSEATARLVSIALRAGLSTDSIIAQLKGIRCPACIRREGVNVTSCPDAIAKVIETYYKTDSVQSSRELAATFAEKELQPVAQPRQKGDGMATCPECGSAINHEGGCVVCVTCGYSKCG